MEVVKNVEENASNEAKEPTFDELKKAYIELSDKYRELFSRARQMESSLMQVERLSWLMKIIEFKASFPKDFVESCVKEITDALSLNDNLDKEKEAE